MEYLGVILGVAGAAFTFVCADLFERECTAGVPRAGYWLAAALVGFTLFMFILGVSTIEVIT